MGLASSEEAKLVVEMTARYPDVKAELEAIEASMENFDQQNAVTPPDHLKAKILSQLTTPATSAPKVIVSEQKAFGGKVLPLNNGAKPEAKQSSFYKYAAAVAFLLVVGCVWYAYDLRQTLESKEAQIEEMNRANEVMVAVLARVDSMYQTENKENLALLDEVQLLKKPGMKTVELKGMEIAPDAKAMVYANTATGDSYLEIMNLPAAPEGMQYQFWGIVNGKPVDAGMIPLEENIDGIHPMKTVPNAVAYAISLEPKGGSEQPQGQIFVMGNS
jgi:anti-sigma-K factor RskA